MADEPPVGQGPPGGYGTWRLRPGLLGPSLENLDLTIELDPIAFTDCDHRHQTSAHDPGDRLRHLVEIRDGDPGWQLTQDLPGYHIWTTPSGRTYSGGPATYPI